ncbi:DUF305 domain-containing protein [Saccharopolyspora taberi]|uniref:DUF305 domain-containing protein n=1 Tax=Saccharopolyspora taberi TaxID=60895 RepID=A0ABN3VMX2_9PSEU
MNARSLAAALVAAAALLVAGCSAEPPAAPPAQQQADHNQADVTFAQGMVPHHQQAIEMADQVPSRTSNPAVIGLADRIRAAQQPEIDKLNGWLSAWGASATGGTDHGGMDHGGMDHGQMGHDMGGMMSADDMAALERAQGPEFDRMWLQMMVEHHRGAVEMAGTELRDGQHAEAKAMARQIVDSQQAEIDEMNALLRG